MEPLKVFLDANILFSAALGGSSFDVLWRLAGDGAIAMFSSPYCFIEAERNLSRKHPRLSKAYRKARALVHEVPDANRRSAASYGLPDKDRPVLDAALAAGADVLLTGDRKHFGRLMEDDDVPIRVMTVRAFLVRMTMRA